MKIFSFLFLGLLIVGCNSKAQIDFSFDKSFAAIDSLMCDSLKSLNGKKILPDVDDDYFLALVERKCGETNRAITYLENAIAKDNNDPFKHYLMTLLLIDKYDILGAMHSIKKAEHLFPNNYKILILKAEILYYLGDKRNCFQTLDYIEKFNDRQADSYRIRGLVYRQENNIEKGLENIKKAISKDPNNPYLYFFAGDILIIGKRYLEAIPYLEKCVLMDKLNSDFVLRRGVAYYYSGDKKRAAKDWNESLKMGNKKAKEYIETYL